MKRKIILLGVAVILIVSLTASLAATACAPKSPGAEGEDCSAIEAQLSDSEKQVDDLESEVDDLEAEIKTLKQPAKVYEWEPSIHISAGQMWDALVMMSEEVEKMSDGRMVWTPMPPGAVCAVEEQLDAVASGMTECVETSPSYFTGKIPVLFVESDAMGMTNDIPEMYELHEVWEDGRLNELFNEGIAGYGDVVRVAHHYYPSNPVVITNFPLDSVSDLQGHKMRAWDWFVDVFTALGASGTWIPGPELYTSMSTGVIDGLCYANAPDYVDLSFNEISKYWLKWPAMFGPSCQTMYVNGTVWNDLPDDLKSIVKNAEIMAQNMNFIEFSLRDAEAWRFAEDYGITMCEWPKEDLPVLKQAYKSAALDRCIDDASTEAYEVLERWCVSKGYWAAD